MAQKERPDCSYPMVNPFLDRLALPVVALILAGLVLLPDVIGIGTPGLGLWEILLLAVSVAMVIGSIALPIRPLTALQNKC